MSILSLKKNFNYNPKEKVFHIQYFTEEKFLSAKNNIEIGLPLDYEKMPENSILLYLDKSSLFVGKIELKFFKILFDSRILWIYEHYFE